MYNCSLMLKSVVPPGTCSKIGKPITTDIHASSIPHPCFEVSKLLHYYIFF